MLFLEGREDDVIGNLNEKMNAAAEARRYEEAAAYRDQVRALARVQVRQYVESNRGVDADVVACVVEGEIACVNLVMIRTGRHVGDRSFFPANAEGAAPGEVVAAFLEQHYLEQPMPSLIVTSEPVELEECDHAFPRRAQGVARHGAQERAARDRAARARPRHAGRRACSRCAKRSACPKARSASSASTSATRWARRRWPRAWSTTGSRCRSPSTGASTSATSRRATTTPRCARCWRGATSASPPRPARFRT